VRRSYLIHFCPSKVKDIDDKQKTIFQVSLNNILRLIYQKGICAGRMDIK
jgi:hypothetical protein